MSPAQTKLYTLEQIRQQLGYTYLLMMPPVVRSRVNFTGTSYIVRDTLHGTTLGEPLVISIAEAQDGTAYPKLEEHARVITMLAQLADS